MLSRTMYYIVEYDRPMSIICNERTLVPVYIGTVYISLVHT